MSYTLKEEKRLLEESPLTYLKAKDLACELSKTTRSIISKAVMLGIYKKLDPPPKRIRIYKRNIVRRIEATYGCEPEELKSLEQAERETLLKLLKIAEEL